MSLFKSILHKSTGGVFLAALFGFGYVTGDILVYHPQNTFNLLTLITGLLLSGFYYLFFILLTIVIKNRFFTNTNIKIIKFFKSHPFRNTFFVLIIFWLGHLIVKYPAGQCPDSYTQIKMGLSKSGLTAHHPLVSTLLLAKFVRFGINFGSSNFGIFLYVTIEALILAAIFSCAMEVLQKKIHASDTVLLISLLFFSFSPYIVGYVGQAIKDVYYCGGFVLLITAIAAYKNGEELHQPVMIAKLICSAALMCFFRKEGLIILIICFLFIAVSDILKNKRVTIGIAVLILSILIPSVINHTLEQKYQPKESSIREALSLPFQQTARYVIQHRDIMSEEETAAVSKVLEIDRIPDRYIPWISDQVKDLYNEDATKEDLIAYFRAWAIGFRKAPLCYIRATLEQNIYLIYPGFNNYIYYVDANSGAAYLFGSNYLFSTPEFIHDFQSEYLSLLDILHNFPVLNIFNNMVFYIWLLFAFILIAIREKNRCFLFLSFPLVLTILLIIAAPCIRGSVRYAFPIIWSFPIWLGCLISGSSPEPCDPVC